MKTAVLYETHAPLIIEELELNQPAHGEVRIKLQASGVCHSDWHIIKGEWTHVPLPVILGHEGAGVVEAIGPNVQSLAVGDHVILSWRSSCGLCEMCQQGWPNLCERAPIAGNRARVRGQVVNQLTNLGTFSTHTVVPEIAAVRIDPNIPFAQAALLGCGVATGVGAAINTARVKPGSSVAVFGCGGVGLNCIQGSRLAGASTIIAVDLLDAKLELARRFGATHTINAASTDPVECIHDLTGGGAHYAFEAIGLAAEPFVQSIRCTRRRGTTIWVGHAPHDTPVTIDARDLINEKKVMGSLYGSSRPQVDFPRLLALYREEKLQLDELVSRRFALDEVNAAFAALARGEVARSVLEFA